MGITHMQDIESFSISLVVLWFGVMLWFSGHQLSMLKNQQQLQGLEGRNFPFVHDSSIQDQIHPRC